jgi:hypothetical protein
MKKGSVVRVTREPERNINVLQNGTQNNKEKLKKPIIFGLMGLYFSAVCTSYLNRPKIKRKSKTSG